MEIPPKIQYAAQRLREGNRVNRITVRDFLRHFGVERRGAIKVEEIRSILESLDLQTEPDFETAWIDEPVWLRLKGSLQPQVLEPERNSGFVAEDLVLGSTPSAVEQAVKQSQSAPYSAEVSMPAENKDSESSDPTFRIGRLPAANKPLVTVNQNDELTRAITLMLQYDFSQLPVMQGEREVKGVITWKSIGVRKAFGSACERVGALER
jgi:CBS domain-containing protein